MKFREPEENLKLKMFMVEAMRPGKKLKVVFLNILKYFIIATGDILILDLKAPRFSRINIW